MLVSTAAPGLGGVDAMTRFAVDCLSRNGMEPVLAHYAPYSTHPQLSVPVYRLGQRAIGASRTQSYTGIETHAFGAWLPELEFTHYTATAQWKTLMDTCDAHISVSGNVLAATPFLQTARPYVAWVATDWDGDRKDRVKGFPAVRRLLDASINGPVIRRLEQRLLTHANVLSLSEYTASRLAEIVGPTFHTALLPVPVDTKLFSPSPMPATLGRIGFAGRFTDPRKNIGLLLESVSLLRQQGHDATLVLMGDIASQPIMVAIEAHGLKAHVLLPAQLSRTEMAVLMQSLDVFALPSHQEGLCIAALEAMACGVPVVSTRCGGPQEFVIDGETGYLTDANPQAMARSIASIIGDRPLRARMAQAARRMVDDRYTNSRTEAVFLHALHTTFAQLAS